MNWVKLFNSWEAMAGQWGYSEPVIGKRVKNAATKIQYLHHPKINFACIQENEIYITSIDGMHCKTEEYRLEPSAKGY